MTRSGRVILAMWVCAMGVRCGIWVWVPYVRSPYVRSPDVPSMLACMNARMNPSPARSRGGGHGTTRWHNGTRLDVRIQHSACVCVCVCVCARDCVCVRVRVCVINEEAR